MLWPSSMRPTSISVSVWGSWLIIRQSLVAKTWYDGYVEDRQKVNDNGNRLAEVTAEEFPRCTARLPISVHVGI